MVGCILDYLTPKHPFNGHSGCCRIKYRTMAQPAVGKGIPAAPPSNLGLADVLKNHGTLFEQLSKPNMELQNRMTVQQQNHDAQMRMVAEEMKLMTDANKTVVARLAEMESRAGSSNAGHPTPQAPPTATVTESPEQILAQSIGTWTKTLEDEQNCGIGVWKYWYWSMEQMKELEKECLGHYENTLSGLSNYPTFTKRIKEEVIEKTWTR